MLVHDHPLLRACHWKNCVTQLRDTFQVSHLVDIGTHVRHMLMGLTPCNQLGVLLQYSMPYIKHNRLSFPMYEVACARTE